MAMLAAKEQELAQQKYPEKKAKPLRGKAPAEDMLTLLLMRIMNMLSLNASKLRLKYLFRSDSLRNKLNVYLQIPIQSKNATMMMADLAAREQELAQLMFMQNKAES